MGFRVMHNHNSSHKYVKIHTAMCKHYNQTGIKSPSNVDWYGIFDTYAEAQEIANGLGVANVSNCGHCHPDRT
jgi:hypothetical protein